jgi:hypothetical protein
VRLRGEADGWVYLYILLELQSTSDRFMAVRLLTYVGLLLEEIVHKENLKPGDRLPVVLPLVLHNGKGRWHAPLNLESLFVPVPTSLKRYLPRLSYLLVDERRLDLELPGLERNPAAALFRIETNEDEEALPDLYQHLHEILSPGDLALRRIFHEWFVSVARRSFPNAIIPEGVNLEEASMLEETMIKWREKHRQEGRTEGRREGQAQGMQKLLLQQMTYRFGRVPANVRREIEGIFSIQELRKLGRKVLRAKSLEEMGLG